MSPQKLASNAHRPSPSDLTSPTSSLSEQKCAAPRTFRTTINSRLDNPLVSLFRLAIRVLQLIFALAAGASYAVELSQGRTASAFIYSQVVFAITLITLVVDALTLRGYRLTFVVESLLCILWLALFGVFCQIYLVGHSSTVPEYLGVDFGRMKRAVWLDLINFLLWLASAIFSTIMCCSGLKAMIKDKIQGRKTKKMRKREGVVQDMEEGVIHEPPAARNGDRLPMYQEIAAIVRSS